MSPKHDSRYPFWDTLTFKGNSKALHKTNSHAQTWWWHHKIRA